MCKNTETDPAERAKLHNILTNYETLISRRKKTGLQQEPTTKCCDMLRRNIAIV